MKKQKLSASFFVRPAGLITRLLGLGLLIFLVFALSVLFAARTSQKAPPSQDISNDTDILPLSSPTVVKMEPPPYKRSVATIPPSPTPEPTVINPTTGWRVITDKKLQFEFEIPPGWIDYNTPDPKVYSYPLQQGTLPSPYMPTHLVSSAPAEVLQKDRSESGIWVSVSLLRIVPAEKLTHLSPDKQFFEYLRGQPQDVWWTADSHWKGKRVGETTVAGYPAIIQIEGPAPDAQIEDFYRYAIYVLRDDKVYRIAAGTLSEQTWQPHEQTILRIAESLRFLSTK